MNTVSAHRVNSFDFEIQPSFNLILDDDVVNALESMGHYLEDLGYRLTLDEMQDLIDQVSDNSLVVGHLKKDLRWAQLRKQKYVYYYLVGEYTDEI